MIVEGFFTKFYTMIELLSHLGEIRLAPYLGKEIKTKKWLVSVNKALLDQEGNITGVLAIDTSLERLVKQLWGMSNRNGSGNFVEAFAEDF